MSALSAQLYADPRCSIYLVSASSKKSPLSREHILRVIEAVRKTFPVVKNDPTVLDPIWKRFNEASGVESTGLCFAATNAVYHLLGGKAAGLTPMNATYYDPELARLAPETQGRASHWWIRDADGAYIDPTADQYTVFGETPPYEIGVGRGFNTRVDQPTQAGQKIIDLAQQLLR